MIDFKLPELGPFENVSAFVCVRSTFSGSSTIRPVAGVTAVSNRCFKGRLDVGPGLTAARMLRLCTDDLDGRRHFFRMGDCSTQADDDRDCVAKLVVSLLACDVGKAYFVLDQRPELVFPFLKEHQRPESIFANDFVSLSEFVTADSLLAHALFNWFRKGRTTHPVVGELRSIMLSPANAHKYQDMVLVLRRELPGNATSEAFYEATLKRFDDTVLDPGIPVHMFLKFLLACMKINNNQVDQFHDARVSHLKSISMDDVTDKFFKRLCETVSTKPSDEYGMAIW